MVLRTPTSLARRCAHSSEASTGLIAESSARTHEGVAQAEAVREVFAEIDRSTEQVAGLLAAVTTDSSQVAHNLGDVERAMGQLDNVTQTNAASSEELAAQAIEMKQSLKILQEKLGSFHTRA